MTLLGVDLAYYQGTPAPWDAIQKAGVQFAFIKASQWDFLDPAFRANQKAIPATGIQPGYYHFLTGDNPANQADFFLNAVGDPAGKLMAFDVETVRTGADPVWQDVKAFVQRFHQLAPGHPLICYTAGWYWRGHLGNPDAAGLDVELWNAYYVGVKGPLKTLDQSRATFRAGYGGWHRAAFHQFSSEGLVGGRKIDVDLFNGSMADLRALTDATPAKPKTIPLTERPRYQARYNETLDAISAAIPGIQLPTAPTGPAGIAGMNAAREDAIDALAGSRLT